MPLSLSDSGDALSQGVGGAPKPPCKGMIKTVSVAWHANDRSQMGRLSESAISTVGVWHEDVPLKQRGKKPEEKHPGWPSESGTAGHYAGTRNEGLGALQEHGLWAVGRRTVGMPKKDGPANGHGLWAASNTNNATGKRA